MDSPSSPNRSPRSPQKSKRGRNSPKDNVKSCFSDDEIELDREGHDDLTHLADKEDVLKGSRKDLYASMSARLKQMSPGKKKGTIIEESRFSEAREGVSATSNIPQQKERLFNLYKVDDGSSQQLRNPNHYELDDQIPDQAARPEMKESAPSMNEIEIKIKEKSSLQTIPDVDFETDRPVTTRNEIEELPPMEGYLMKKTTNMFKSWQKRYFVLKKKKLYYYMDASRDVRSGVLDFDLITVKLEKGTSEPTIMIAPLGTSRVFVLKAANEEEREKWFKALKLHTLYSRGGYVDLFSIAKINKFWKNDRISPDTFWRYAETGDIILFKSETIVSKIQRSVTMSEYDHVALIYRNRNQRVFLFEAMREGVGLCGWDTFVEKNWHKLYSKMIYRKLMIERTPEVMKELEHFIKSNVGKKYKITPSKLLQKKAKAGKEENTFFCSELVAACYKRLKFLPEEISSSYYFPNSFTAKKKLELKNGAKLSQEYLIDFNLLSN